MAIITSRDIETLQHSDQNIARCGTVAKRCSDPVPTHNGMVHVKDDVTYRSMSATQVATALAGGKSPTDAPVIGKKLTDVTIKPGMTNRTSPELEDDNAHRALGAAVLAQAALRVRGK